MSSFRCERCSSVVAIPTRKWRLRGKGHVKHMWCWKCGKKTSHKLL